MLADLDETIRRLLIRDVPIDPTEVDVSFEAPDREWSGRLSKPAVNCFLFDLRENHQFRENDWEMQRTNGRAVKRKAPARIDVAYQVTTWARAPEDEHRLLWRVLAALFRHQILPEDLLEGSLIGQPFPVPAKVAQPEQAPKNPADLWTALENRIRPSLVYVVTLALDPEAVVTAPLVFTRFARVRDLISQDTVEVIQIGGRVRDRTDPSRGVAGITVLLRETGVETTTDAEGRFIFRRAPRGQVTLVVRAAGRPEIARAVDVPSPHYDLDL